MLDELQLEPANDTMDAEVGFYLFVLKQSGKGNNLSLKLGTYSGVQKGALEQKG